MAPSPPMRAAARRGSALRARSRAIASALALVAVAAGTPLIAPAHAAQAPPVTGAPPSANVPKAPRALRTSRNLWATIDVCNPRDQRYTAGIRGSMPSEGRSGESMFMRFRLQYLNEASWVDLPGAASGLLRLPAGNREDGFSFTLKPPPSGSMYTLRGVVSFQWRRGSSMLAVLSRATSAGHQSGSGADPPGFSAAQCKIA